MVAYRKGDWARALSEFRTVRRLSGSSHLLPAHGRLRARPGPPGAGRSTSPPPPRPRRWPSRSGSSWPSWCRASAATSASIDAALLALQIPQLKRGAARPWSARLYYAYAEALLAWAARTRRGSGSLKAVTGDDERETDAAERLEELDGIVLDARDDERADDDARTRTAPEPGRAR